MVVWWGGVGGWGVGGVMSWTLTACTAGRVLVGFLVLVHFSAARVIRQLQGARVPPAPRWRLRGQVAGYPSLARDRPPARGESQSPPQMGPSCPPGGRRAPGRARTARPPAAQSFRPRPRKETGRGGAMRGAWAATRALEAAPAATGAAAAASCSSGSGRGQGSSPSAWDWGLAEGVERVGHVTGTAAPAVRRRLAALGLAAGQLNAGLPWGPPRTQALLTILPDLKAPVQLRAAAAVQHRAVRLVGVGRQQRRQVLRGCGRAGAGGGQPWRWRAGGQRGCRASGAGRRREAGRSCGASPQPLVFRQGAAVAPAHPRGAAG